MLLPCLAALSTCLSDPNAWGKGVKLEHPPLRLRQPAAIYARIEFHAGINCGEHSLFCALESRVAFSSRDSQLNFDTALTGANT